MITFHSTNETIEGCAIVLEEYTNSNGYKSEEKLFEVYRELKHCKSALKSNRGLRYWNNGKVDILPHRIEKVRIIIERMDE